MAQGTRPLNHIYVCLDSLLDTRLSVIDKINPDYAVEVVKHKNYFSRQSDFFSELVSGFPDDKYKEAWDNRTKDDIIGSAQTLVNAKLHSHISDHILGTADSPYAGNTVITLNTWPYDIDDAGKKVLKELIRVNFMSEGRVVNIPLDMLTPDTIKGNYNDMYIYEFDKWLGLHIEDLKNKPMPQVFVHYPLLRHTKGTRTGADFKKAVEYFTFEMSSHLTLKPLSIETFCIGTHYK